MACLIKAPDGGGKGCVSFTTPERDQVINKDSDVRGAIESLKERYLIGLHHNWHDHAFVYDPLFDFSMAGDGDLIERDGRPFARIPLDACNFAPACFTPRQDGLEPFWDVLNVSRAVFFKGIPEFFQAIRTIYDRGRLIRVLHICPVPPPSKNGTHTNLLDIRQRYEAAFSPDERQLFTLLTMEWDYPFPLDLETLAFFIGRAESMSMQRLKNAAVALPGTRGPAAFRLSRGRMLRVLFRRNYAAALSGSPTTIPREWQTLLLRRLTRLTVRWETPNGAR